MSAHRQVLEYVTDAGKTIRVFISGTSFVAKIDGVSAFFYARKPERAKAKALAFCELNRGII